MGDVISLIEYKMKKAQKKPVHNWVPQNFGNEQKKQLSPTQKKIAKAFEKFGSDAGLAHKNRFGDKTKVQKED